MEPSTTTDPVGYPTITLGDPNVSYPLRYRHKDIVSLWRDHKIDLLQKISGIEAIERMPTIVAIGLAHLGDRAPSFQEIKDHIENLDVGELSIFSLAVSEAQKKVSPAALRASEVLAKGREQTPTAGTLESTTVN